MGNHRIAPLCQVLLRHLAPGITDVGHTASGQDSSEGLSHKSPSKTKKQNNKELRVGIIKLCSAIFFSKVKTIKEMFLLIITTNNDNNMLIIISAHSLQFTKCFSYTTTSFTPHNLFFFHLFLLVGG